MSAEERPSGTSPQELAREVWEEESPATVPPPRPATGAEPDHPRLLELPVGTGAEGTRTEHDSMGDVEVPAAHYWGAQTQRSRVHFAIGDERMPLAVVHAYGHVKRAAAAANAALGRLPAWKADAIARVCAEIVAGELDDEFPLSVFQTGSGTHTNANVNEVVANRANQLLGSRPGSASPIRPDDDVNMSQSSNDTFVTAMHVAAYDVTTRRTLAGLTRLQAALDRRAAEWASVLKVGRTHLMDATPLTVGQEWSGYAAALGAAIDAVTQSLGGLAEVALGGTAVGTGVNAPAGFTALVVQGLATSTGQPLRPARNPFAAQSTIDPLVRTHAELKTTAVTLFKIANDVRWMASGPRSGLAELRIPANEPGSTIMPGKVNPTQAEAVLMACLMVMGNDVTVSSAGAEGNFELNAFRPLAISTYLRSATVLGDVAASFATHLVDGAQLDEGRLAAGVERSVMVLTALSPVIGYERAAAIVRDAVEHDLPAREAALRHGVSADVYDEAVRSMRPPDDSSTAS